MITSASRTNRRCAGRPSVIVLVGIDGAGKTTAARAIAGLLQSSVPVLLLRNYSGRRTMKMWMEARGVTAPIWFLDLAESVIRTTNVVVNHARASTFDGVVIMDRHLHCQQALRSARGQCHAQFLGAMTALLPSADIVVFLDVSAEVAHRRITARGTDTETLDHLQAYRQGYLGLPEADRFHRVPADGPLSEVLGHLERLVGDTHRAAFSGAVTPKESASQDDNSRATPRASIAA